MSNCVDPDETVHNEPSHLDLRCLQKPIMISYGSEILRVKEKILQLSFVDLSLCFVHPVWHCDDLG